MGVKKILGLGHYQIELAVVGLAGGGVDLADRVLLRLRGRENLRRSAPVVL